MCGCDQTLDFEAMLSDPLIRLVMDSDGVSVAELGALLAETRMALAFRADITPTSRHWQ